MNHKKLSETRQFIENLSGKRKFSVSRNSHKLGLSRQTYQNKIDKLRDKEIISNFIININPYIQPNNLKFVLLEIKTNPKEPILAKDLLKIPQLRMLDGIIGEFSLFGLLNFRSSEEYYQTLNRIDNIMAGSHFKKYQIIETIRVFKTNGISLREMKMTIREKVIYKISGELNEWEIKVQEKFELDEINQKLIDKDVEHLYNPQQFPELVFRNKDSKSSIIFKSNGLVIFREFEKDRDRQIALDKFFKILSIIGVNLDEEPDYKIDETDYNILKILRDHQGDKPISTYEIKKICYDQFRIDISQSTIHNRIKRLEKNGIILNYTVNFNPKKAGFTGKYLLRLKPRDPSHYDELALKLEKIPEITDLFRIGEQFGLFAIVRVKNIEDYAQFIKDLYEEEIEDTYTNFVLDELIPYTNFIIF
jgi:Lrp/AsnC family transcriptional regulator for asnA, asnC and gidA